MQAKDTHLLRFLEQGSFSFVIPVYQRNYDWSIEQCEQLLHDLEVIIETNLSSYFLGSIVYISERQSVSLSNVNKILIIDGQQRLTTISLLLVAIANNIEDEKKRRIILDKYILNELAEGDEKIKLKPIKDDLVAFSSVIRQEELVENNSVTNNFRYFKQYIENCKFQPDQIFDAIGRLKIVDISLEVGIDNPQLIFESLNSTGLDLSSSDLIRNFVLMNQDIKKQEELYQKFWRQIERNCNFKTDDFIRHYITFKEGYIPNKNKVYKAFKNYRFRNSHLTVEEILLELLKFSKIYYSFETGLHSNSLIANQLKRLKRLDMSVTYPFLLEVFDDLESADGDGSKIISSLKILENYIVRRFICDVATNGMNKVFVSLNKEIKKIGENWKNKFVEYLSYVLANKKSNGRFPRNTEVQEALLTKNVYNMQAKNKLFFLESIENFDNKEKIDVYAGLESNQFSIEHIMPQTLTKEWREELGADFKLVHEEFINVIGNLTFTAYNSNLKNKPFTEKKEIGFNDSRFWLNSYVKNQSHWTKEQIIERTSIITDRFFNVWPELKFPEGLIQSFDDEVSLSEDYDFTNKDPKAIILASERFEVDSFRQMRAKYLGYLFKLNAEILYKFQEDEKSSRVLIANTTKNMKVPLEILPDIYTEGYHSAQSTIRTLKKLVSLYGIDEDEVIVVLNNDSN